MKNYLSGIFVIRMETQDGLANQLSMTRMMGLPESYLEKYVTRIRSVEPDQIQSAAKKYFTPGDATIVVVGDASETRQAAREVRRGDRRESQTMKLISSEERYRTPYFLGDPGSRARPRRLRDSPRHRAAPRLGGHDAGGFEGPHSAGAPVPPARAALPVGVAGGPARSGRDRAQSRPARASAKRPAIARASGRSWSRFGPAPATWPRR